MDGHSAHLYAILLVVIKRPVFIYKLLEFAEAAMIASTLSVGLVATGTAAIKGTEPPDFSTFVVAIQPPYESDDKRIYPEILDEKTDTEIPHVS